MIPASQQLETYLEHFSQFERAAVGRDLAWLRALRENGFRRFCEVGFPTLRDEDWRFTNVSAIAETPFRIPRAGAQVSSRDLDPWRIAHPAGELVFFNGRFVPELSSRNLPPGAEAGSLAARLTTDSPSVEAHLGAYLSIERDAFSALNTAFAEDGAYVRIPRGTVVDRPIHLLFVSAGSGAPAMTNPRNLILAEEESQAAIIEDYISLDEDVAFCNTATEFVVGDNATVSHYMLERENRQAFNVSTLRIQQGRNANVASHSLLVGGALVRNNVHPVLAGEGGECLINGLFLGTDRQHLDNYMLVEHAKPHCGSRQFYNGILDGHAHGVFHGRIIVHKDAQKTDAKQTNRNLLLSDDAQIDTKPQLEIYADDVKCTHGATIGQIEEDALFYLRSRGLDEAAARKLLLLAFASECLERMREEPVRRYVEGLINDRLFQAARPRERHAQAAAAETGRRWEETQ
ncbi:MAG TPA: Fe-S cluster assembly protein SufD [Candidatus Cybelea sp.]|nr:Fe-S cluster assembly protein SufD [Candidatus Cybelea sp.]